MRIVIFKDRFKPDAWKFAVRGSHGEHICTSFRSYETRDEVVEAVRLLKRARITNID
jgi:hypothetical protein